MQVSNNSLASLSDLLIQAKELPSFRDYSIIPTFLKPRQNIWDNARADITPDKVEAEKEYAK